MQWQIGACFMIHIFPSNLFFLMSNPHSHCLGQIDENPNFVGDTFIFIPADCGASNLETLLERLLWMVGREVVPDLQT